MLPPSAVLPQVGHMVWLPSVLVNLIRLRMVVCGEIRRGDMWYVIQCGDYIRE